MPEGDGDGDSSHEDVRTSIVSSGDTAPGRNTGRASDLYDILT